jgi:hypothetical protein
MAGLGVEDNQSVEWLDWEVELAMPVRLNWPYLEVEFPTWEEWESGMPNRAFGSCT